METRSIPGGLFLALEGPEGAGKTANSARLRDWLTSLGFAVVPTREPGGTQLGEQIRPLLLGHNMPPLSAEAELFLFLAARAQLVREVIAPSLEAGRVVISDRYSTSTLVYQGYGLGVNLSLVRATNYLATGGLEPALTILLDIDPSQGLARRRGDQLLADRIEARGSEFHERIRRGYLEVAKEQPERFRVLDASGSQEEVWALVRREVSLLLLQRCPELAVRLRPDGQERA
jgi:dTMP kinase